MPYHLQSWDRSPLIRLCRPVECSSNACIINGTALQLRHLKCMAQSNLYEYESIRRWQLHGTVGWQEQLATNFSCISARQKHGWRALLIMAVESAQSSFAAFGKGMQIANCPAPFVCCSWTTFWLTSLIGIPAKPKLGSGSKEEGFAYHNDVAIIALREVSPECYSTSANGGPTDDLQWNQIVSYNSWNKMLYLSWRFAIKCLSTVLQNQLRGSLWQGRWC